jgi:predicted transcriptional regulator
MDTLFHLIILTIFQVISNPQYSFSYITLNLYSNAHVMAGIHIIDTEIGYYFNQLSTKQKEIVLSVVKTLAHDETDFWESVEENAKQSIEKGLEQAKRREVLPHAEVTKNIPNWPTT